ncbi:MAG: aromatic amino acid lyase, partial [Peptoanaerobacter stomatis]
MKEFKEVVLTGNDLTLEELVAVTRHNVKAVLSEETIKNIEDSRKIIDDIVENERVIYGVTTGFGEFSKVSISKEDCKTLQENLI